MNDATIVRWFHLWGKKNRIQTATIHDGFFTNISDSVKAKFALRDMYAKAVEGETLLNTLKAMRQRGLSEKSYQKLLAQARADGLLSSKDGITAKEILDTIPEGWDWYGIGP